MKVAIAGAGRGIGAACARALRGHQLFLCSRTAAEVQAVAADTGGFATVADLSVDAGQFAETAGPVDLLLICIGSAHAAVALEDAPAELQKKNFFLNSVAPGLVAAAFLQRGAKRILFLSSLATRRPPMPGAGPYTAAKAALEAMVRAFAEESKARVNAICLGPVRTRLHEQAGTPREWIEQFPAPDEIAPLILKAAALPGTGRIIDAGALARDASAALAGDGRLAEAEALMEPEVEAEPGRRPSPRVRAALRASAAALHVYPRGTEKLAERLGALHGVGGECIALSGGGATELIERALRVFCAPNDEVASPFPTFEVLSALCTRQGVRHRPVPIRRDAKEHSAKALEAAIGPRTRLIYVASPDNPTGLVLREPIRAEVPLILDEAWSMEPPAAREPPQSQEAPPSTEQRSPAVMQLRSFSKLHGLAALRVAYAVGEREPIALLRKLQLPFPLGAPQIAAVNAVLDEPERTRRAAVLLTRERARVAAGLRALGCTVNDSPAPILLVRHQLAGRLLFALRAASLPVQEAHWDAQTVVVPLGRKAANARLLAAARRALESQPPRH